MPRLHSPVSKLLSPTSPRNARELLQPSYLWHHVTPLLAALSLFLIIGLVEDVPKLRGDGWEYYLMASNWAERGTPWVDANAISSLKAVQSNPAIALPQHLYKHGDNQYDSPHFWLYSALASPFIPLCAALNLPAVDAFLFLHTFLFGLCGLAVQRAFGQKGLALLVAFLLASPAIWYINRAHTEFYTFALLLLVLILLRDDRLLPAAFCATLVGAQNLSFMPFPFGLFVLWLIRSRKERLTIWQAFLLTSTVVIAIAPPMYYLLRHGALHPLALSGQAGADAITFQKAASLFVDPDIGLFSNWPLGLVLVGIALTHAKTVGTAMMRCRVAFAFSAIFFIVLPFLQSTAVNWNSAGTVAISRYAIWYLPVFLFWLLHVLHDLRGRTYLGIQATPHHRLAFVGLCVVGLLLAIGNLFIYFPLRGEIYTHTAFGNWFYDHCAGCYAPVPEVFAERSAGHEINMRSVASTGPWFYSNRECTKVLVVGYPKLGSKNSRLSKPEGCAVPLDGAKIAQYLMERVGSGKLPQFTEVPQETLKAFCPMYSGRVVLSFEDPASANFLGRGWSIQESKGRWTNGRSAEVVLNRSQASRDVSGAALLFMSGTLYDSSEGSADVTVTLNGSFLGKLDSTSRVAPETYRFEIQETARSQMRLLLSVRNPKSRYSGGDARELGFYLRTLSLLPAARVKDGVVPELAHGECVDFANPYSVAYLGSGWSAQEPNGRWSDGTDALLRFHLSAEQTYGEAAGFVTLAGVAFTEHTDTLRGVISQNGLLVKRFSLKGEVTAPELRLRVAGRAEGYVEVVMHFDNPKPTTYRADRRRLGFYIKRLCLE